MYCPNCGKNTVSSELIDSQEHYYESNYWKKSNHNCDECLASFINFDNGMDARIKRKEEELTDREEYERLRLKYENLT